MSKEIGNLTLAEEIWDDSISPLSTRKQKPYYWRLYSFALALALHLLIIDPYAEKNYCKC